MARPRQPVELVIAKGKKHLTKAEIEERRSSEVQPVTEGVAAPSFLTAAQKKDFDKISGQLQKLNIMGETDVDTLARYIVAQSLYEQAVKDLRAAQKQRPDGTEPKALVDWAYALEVLDKRVERYFKQATSSASKLGLTITDRCRLVVPVKDEDPKPNKFSRFGVIAGRATK